MVAEWIAGVLIGLTVVGLAIKVIDSYVVVNAMREKISPGDLYALRKAATGKARNGQIGQGTR
jgi:hypothetical protein